MFLYWETFALILKLQRFACSGHGKGGVPCRTGDIKNTIKFNFSEFFWNFPKLFRWKWRKSRGVMIQVASDQNHLHGYRKIHLNDDQRNNQLWRTGTFTIEEENRPPPYQVLTPHQSNSSSIQSLNILKQCHSYKLLLMEGDMIKDLNVKSANVGSLGPCHCTCGGQDCK